jgi:hypothetical protein
MIAGRAANKTDDGAAPSSYTGARIGRQADNGRTINRFGAILGGGLRAKRSARGWYKSPRRSDRPRPGRIRTGTHAHHPPRHHLDRRHADLGAAAMIRGFMREVLSIAAW